MRGVIPIRSIESAFRIADGVGYVKLGQFARTTFDEFRKALASLRAEGVTKLIFDLRGNSGGFLDQAIAVANEFLHEGQLIVYTEDRRHEQLREYADGKGSAQDMEVVVLIDEGSAVERNSRRSVAGQRPWYDYWSSFVRQGSRTASDTVQRRIGPAADHGALLYADGPLDPEALHDRG